MATVELTEDNLPEILNAPGIVIIDFWAGWCIPCRVFSRIYESMSTKHPDIVFGKVNTEVELNLTLAFKVTTLPTLMVFRDGHVVYAQPGAMRSRDLAHLIGAARELDMDEVRRRR
ncbi:MAG: thioredoxin family protein [Propionibacterium sp.]|nr:thioredoxin family protein [Propionibacterium sp.]